MFKLFFMGLAAYFIFKIVKFFMRISNAINQAGQKLKDQPAQTQHLRKNPADIIDADFIDITPKAGEKEEIR